MTEKAISGARGFAAVGAMSLVLNDAKNQKATTIC